jgi:hypothetical protein
VTTRRVAGYSCIHLIGESRSLERTDHISWTAAAVNPARLTHQVAHLPPVINTHHVEVAQQHLGVGIVVEHNASQGPHKAVITRTRCTVTGGFGGVEVDGTAWAYTHTTPQGIVQSGIFFDLHVGHPHQPRV